jgi:hypothetical protein
MPAPLSDAVITAVSQMVDDSQLPGGRHRDPSHEELTFIMQRTGVAGFEENRSAKPIGKAKRVRWVLSECLSRDVGKGEAFVSALIEKVRGYGGFRDGSQNFVGKDAIENARAVFRAEGYELLDTGELVPAVLDNLSGEAMTSALFAYARRARTGSRDAALLVGTGKDLLEATAKHVLDEKHWTYDARGKFPMLLGQAFTALSLATIRPKDASSQTPAQAMESSLYELGCGVNRLRNTQGTGHGRPFLPTVTDVDSVRIRVDRPHAKGCVEPRRDVFGESFG